MIRTYLAPILQFVILVTATIQLAVQDNTVTQQEVIQILAFMVAPAVTYLVPLSKGRWPGLLKTGLNAALGGLLVVNDVISNGGWVWSANIVLLVGLGVLNALAVEIGLKVRTDALRAGIADPKVSNESVQKADEAGYAVVMGAGR